MPQCRQLATGAWTDEAAFWRAQLAYAPLLLELPTDRARPLLLGTQAGAAVLASPAGLAARLDALAAGSNATLFMAVLAAWKVRGARHPLCSGHACLEGAGAWPGWRARLDAPTAGSAAFPGMLVPAGWALRGPRRPSLPPTWLQVLLSRYAREEDVVVGTDHANRQQPELEGTVGCISNLLALRTDLSGELCVAWAGSHPPM